MINRILLFATSLGLSGCGIDGLCFTQSGAERASSQWIEENEGGRCLRFMQEPQYSCIAPGVTLNKPDLECWPESRCEGPRTTFRWLITSEK